MKLPDVAREMLGEGLGGDVRAVHVQVRELEEKERMRRGEVTNRAEKQRRMGYPVGAMVGWSEEKRREMNDDAASGGTQV